MNGYEYEEKCGEYLLATGYSRIEVTQKSNDFGIDIIAYRDNEKFGIQCKYYDKPVGNKAVQEAYAGATYYKCDKSMVITNTTFTKQAKELASKLGVILIEEIDAIKLMEVTQLSPAELVKKKIKSIHDYVEKESESLKQFLENNPIDGDSTNIIIKYTGIKNRCNNLIIDINKQFEEFMTPPCPKTAAEELLDFMKSVNNLYVDITTNIKYGNLRKLSFINSFEDTINKWELFSNRLTYLEGEEDAQMLKALQQIKEQKEEQERIEKQKEKDYFQAESILNKQIKSARDIERAISIYEKYADMDENASNIVNNLKMEREDLLRRGKTKHIVVGIILVVLILFFALFITKYTEYMDNKKMNEIHNAVNEEDWSRAEEINQYFWNKRNHEGWYENDLYIENAKKFSMSPAERVEKYPEDYIDISIPYRTHYMSGVVEYGVEVTNNSDFDVTITSITIVPSVNHNITDEEKIFIDLDMAANSSISTAIDVGEGQKRKGGSYTQKGNVYGGNAYYCSYFTLEVDN